MRRCCSASTNSRSRKFAIGRNDCRAALRRFFDSLFHDLAKWAATPRYSGAGFTRVAMELADLPGHPARAVARQHKAAIERLLAEALAKAGVEASAERAREVALLMEGAMVLMLLHGDRAYAMAAATAAKRLGRS